MNTRLRRIWLPLGLGALTGAVLLTLASTAGAQTPGDTPAGTEPTSDAAATPTAEPTPGPEVKTVVKITVDSAIQPIPKGDEFEVVVSVDQVEHLAGFDFTISYDPKRIEPVFLSNSAQDATSPRSGDAGRTVKTANLGQFLTSTGREAELQCSDPSLISADQAGVLCSLLGAPLCFGGSPGVSGSGVLAAVYFKSKGGGVTTLSLSRTDLALDDFSDCTAEVVDTVDLPGACLPFRDAAGSNATQLSCEPDGTSGLVAEDPVEADGVPWARLEGLGWADVNYLQASGSVPAIPHRRQNAEIELAKSSGSNTLLIVGIVIVVVVVAAGGGGYLYYRRRQTGGAT